MKAFEAKMSTRC